MKTSGLEKFRHYVLQAVIGASLGLMLSACSSVPPPSPQSWTLGNEYPATSLSGEGDTYLAQAIARRTHGAVNVTALADAKAGYKSREQLQAVAEGKLTMATSFGGALSGSNPIFALPSLPFVAVSLAEARVLIDVARPLYEAALAQQNQILLLATPWPPSGLWAKTPAKSVADVANMSIRTYDKTGAEVFSRLGAKAKVVSFADLAPMLVSGEINAVLSSGDGGAGRKLWEHLPHFTEIGYAVPLSFTTINRDRWLALSPALREQVLAAASETETFVWNALEGRLETNYRRMRDNGMTITSPVPDALRGPLSAAGKSEVEKWLSQAGPEAANALQKFRSMSTAGQR